MENLELNSEKVIKKDEIKEGQVIFDFLQCDICHEYGFKGPAFKCLVCENFDLCQNCQASYHHFHPTLRMTKSSHYPVELRVTFSHKARKYLNKQLQKEEQELKEIKKAELLKPQEKFMEKIDP